MSIKVGDTVLHQLRDADLLVLNKVELVEAAALKATKAWLRHAAPSARVVPASQARLPPAVVMGTALASLRAAPVGGMVSGPTNGPQGLAADALFDSVSQEFDHAVDCAVMAQALSAPDMRLVRAKGSMRDHDGACRSVQVVGARAAIVSSNHARPERLRVFPPCPPCTSKGPGSSLQMLVKARAMTALCA